MWSKIHLRSLDFKETVMKLKSVIHASIRSLWELGIKGLPNPILVSLHGSNCFFTLLQESSMLHNSMKRHLQSMVNKHIDWQGTVVALSLANFTITLPLQVLLPFFHPNLIQIITCYSEATLQIGNNLLLRSICLNIYIHICKNIPC